MCGNFSTSDNGVGRECRLKSKNQERGFVVSPVDERALQ